MIKYLIISLLSGLIASSAFGANGQAMHLVQTLTGDTVILTTFGSRYTFRKDNAGFGAGNGSGGGLYVTIAGIVAPALDQPYGSTAQAYLNNILQNKELYVLITHQEGNHALARVYINQTQDVGALMLQNGYAEMADRNYDQLGSAQRAAYENLSNQSKYKNLGIYANGNMPPMNADAWRNLDVQTYNQPRVNGAPNPALSQDYGRPDGTGIQRNSGPAPSSVTPSPNPSNTPLTRSNGDWRHYPGHQ